MAVKKKKAKAKSKKKAPARRPAARKSGKAGKKPAKKAPVRRAPAKSRKPRPVARPAQPAPPGERLGIVTHYFSHISVAVLKLDKGARLRVGDTIHIRGHTSDFSQRVDSLQVDHAPVPEVGSGDDFGLKVRDHARENDVVYLVR